MIQWPVSQKVVSQRLVVIEKTSKEKNIVTSECTIEMVLKTVREIEHRSSPGLRAQIPCFRWEFASTWILACLTYEEKMTTIY